MLIGLTIPKKSFKKGLILNNFSGKVCSASTYIFCRTMLIISYYVIHFVMILMDWKLLFLASSDPVPFFVVGVRFIFSMLYKVPFCKVSVSNFGSLQSRQFPLCLTGHFRPHNHNSFRSLSKKKIVLAFLNGLQSKWNWHHY